MSTRIQEYHRPTDWPSAQQLLARRDLTTAPLFLSPRPLALEDWPDEVVVDLCRLGLDYVKEEGQFVKIGILTSLQSLVESPLLKSKYSGIISRCADLAGTLGLRHYASLGGLLGDPTAPQETVLALLALDARVAIRTLSGADRSVDLADYITGKAALQPGEIPFEVQISNNLAGSLALERVARTPRDMAIVAAVTRVALKDGLLAEVRVAVAGAFASSRRIENVEKQLSGRALSPTELEKAAAAAVEAASPQNDLRGSAEYRQAMAGVIIRRALLAASQSA